jgi:hypothetical protein
VIAAEDVALLFAATVACAPGPGRVAWKCEGTDRKAEEIVDRIIRALVKKQGCAIDNQGNRRDARNICRQLVLDILCRKKDFSRYNQIIAGFAARNDKEFFRAFGRGHERKRVVFDDTEWWMLLNWDSLKDKTDDDIRKVYSSNGAMTLHALRKRRQRLGL